MRVDNVIRREHQLGRKQRRAIRIEPRVQFQTALVRFRHGKFERIVKRFRRLAHGAGEIVRPRLEFRRIKSIARRTHLENHRVQVQLHRAIQQGEQFLLLLLHRQARFRWPVNISHRRNPRAAEFPLDAGRLHRHRHITGCRARRHMQEKCRQECG